MNRKKIKTVLTLFITVLFTQINYAQTVTIGNQVWTTKNLDVSTFRNGDPIPQAKTDAEWETAGNNKQPAWCYYDNDPANGAKYGKLYNWYAVNDSRGLAPSGYHIPSDAEWTQLTDFLGSEASKKMKSTSGWESYTSGGSKTCPNCKGTNSSGFSGLPGGYRSYVGPFDEVGKYGYWWSSSEGDDFAWYRFLGYDGGNVPRDGLGKVLGLSVRCLRD
jgi:uncharacterized protein (TIGR02145 family)